MTTSLRLEHHDAWAFYARRQRWRERLARFAYAAALSIVSAAVERTLPTYIRWAERAYPAGARAAEGGVGALWAAVEATSVDLQAAYHEGGEHLLDDRDPRFAVMASGADNAYGALLQGLRAALGTRERASDALRGSFWSVGQAVAGERLRGRVVVLRDQSELVLAEPRAFAELAFQERLIAEVERTSVALTRQQAGEISHSIGELATPDQDAVAAFKASGKDNGH